MLNNPVRTPCLSICCLSCLALLNQDLQLGGTGMGWSDLPELPKHFPWGSNTGLCLSAGVTLGNFPYSPLLFQFVLPKGQIFFLNSFFFFASAGMLIGWVYSRLLASWFTGRVNCENCENFLSVNISYFSLTSTVDVTHGKCPRFNWNPGEINSLSL